MFPFLVGCPRSGTTLLRAMLDSHSQMAVPGESHFIPTLVAARDRYDADGRLDVERFVTDLSAHPRFERWELSTSDVRAALLRRPPLVLADAVRRLYGLYAAARGKPRFADKTPDYVLQVPLLAAEFADAVFVHIIRDGRDVALSLVDVDWGVPTIGAAAEMWSSYVAAGRRTGRALGAERYVEVRYEDLVAHPERELRTLCSFLELRYEDRMLAYHERADLVRRPVLSPTSHQRLSLPPTTRMRDWRTELAPADVATFASLAGDLLDDLGYQ